MIRMQQRGIPAVALACLLDCGRRQHDHHGGAIVFLDKTARRRLARDLKNHTLCVSGGPAGVASDSIRGRGHIEKHLNAYAVLTADDAVATVGHRYKRICWQ